MASSALTYKTQKIDPGVGGPAYDPAKAKQLVAAAKAEGYNGKIRITCGNTPVGTEETVTLQAQLQAVGFDVTTELLPPGQANQKILLDGNYDIGCGAASIFDEGPFRGMNQFLSDSVRNRAGCKNPQMDGGDCSAVPRFDDRREQGGDGDRPEGLERHGPVGDVFYAGEWYIGYKDNVHGLVFTRESTLMFQNAYITS